MNFRNILILFSSLLIGGCATPLTLNYAPSSMMTVEGSLKVGNFDYLPGIRRRGIALNQIQNTAMGSIVFDKNIDEHFESAVFTESRFVGIKLNNSDNLLSGNIIEFLIDDLGYNVDWKLKVRYVIERNNRGVCYSKIHTVEKKNTAKFINASVFASLNKVIKLNIEKLFRDPLFLNCISIKR